MDRSHLWKYSDGTVENKQSILLLLLLCYEADIGEIRSLDLNNTDLRLREGQIDVEKCHLEPLHPQRMTHPCLTNRQRIVGKQ